MRRVFVREGLGYVLRVPDLSLDIAVDRLSRTRGELHGELSVTMAMPGTRSMDGHLHSARFNLSAGTSRGALAKTLARRAGTTDVDWDDLLEDFCRRVMRDERDGEPVVDLGTLPMPVGTEYRLDPVLTLGQPTILYGEGGTGKTTLAIGLGVSVKTGAALVDGWVPRRAPNVLVLDWEGGPTSTNRRIAGVAMGAHIPGPVTLRYMDCRRRGALHGFAEDVARMVQLEDIGLVIVDSVGMASGTSSDGADANESAIRLFAAFGYLGTTVLAVDHVSKAESDTPGKPARPYGSIYKVNLARATYELRRQELPDGSSVLGLYNTKANDAAKLPPQALRVTHADDGAISYERLDQLPTELATPLRQVDRIAAVLAEGHMTSEQIADVTDIPHNAVRAVLSRHKRRFNRLASGVWELLPDAARAG